MFGALAMVAAVGCHGSSPASSADAALPPSTDAITTDAAIDVRLVPWLTGTITLDGDLSESDWHDTAMRLVFVGDDGQQARPYSDARFLRDATNLYVGMYAADENIESTDFFQLDLAQYDLRINPKCAMAASAPGATAQCEYDGTIDDNSDYDEEWVVEMVMPLSLASLDTTAPSAARSSRCDVTKDSVLRCGAIATELAASTSNQGSGSGPL